MSIIVPVYNAEKTLYRCLKSITAQSYRQLEIIVIDDGSTDKSPNIAHAFGQKDYRVRIKRQRNTGPAGARNLGLNIATGHYVQFVDADDFIDLTMSEQLVSQMEKVDLVISGYKSHKKVIIPKYKGIYKKTTAINLFGYLYKETIIQSPCNKLYKAQIINDNNISFSEADSFGEDLRFNLAYLTQCEKLAFIQEALYTYTYSRQSLTNSYIDHLFDKQLAIFKEVYLFLTANDGNSFENVLALREHFINSMIHTASNIIHKDSPYRKREQIAQLKQLRKETFLQIHLPYFTHNLQARLVKFLFKYRADLGLFIFLHLKEIIRKRCSPLFKLIKKLTG